MWSQAAQEDKYREEALALIFWKRVTCSRGDSPTKREMFCNNRSTFIYVFLFVTGSKYPALLGKVGLKESRGC